MSKSELIKLSGWAFILGGFSFAAILTGSDLFAIPGSEISAILLAVGLLGLRARYGEHVGGFSRASLLLGASGPILLVIVIAMGLSGILTETQITEGLWVLLFGGPAISLLGVSLFGLAALSSQPMPRMNWLPFFAGIWYPAVYFFLAGYLFTHDGEYPGQYHAAMQIIFLIQFLALCALGAVLVSDTPQEMTTV
ncbi:MAG: hypothetical protein EHM33_09975 [Chloroflexi bacterium]|nr:MAG: hypothetical protein EHM33_09975 [Chloroflexota bacterium]